MLTMSEMMNKSPLSPDEDKLLLYTATAISMLGVLSTIVWKAYKLCGGRRKYVVKHGFTEVVPFVVVDPTNGRDNKPKVVEANQVVGADRREAQAGHEITQL